MHGSAFVVATRLQRRVESVLYAALDIGSLERAKSIWSRPSAGKSSRGL